MKQPEALSLVLDMLDDLTERTIAAEARIAILEQIKPEKGEPGESIKGEPGTGLAGALIDREGNLILTLSDGTTKELGRVVGLDGMNANTELKSGDMTDDEFDAKVQKLLSGDAAIAVEETGQEGANDANPALTTDVLEHDDG